MNVTTSSVRSRDGTTIGYWQVGDGPGVIVLHGAMESARSHMELAGALAPTFTVYLPDRRGRGLSGPFGKEYSVQKEVEDMDALLTKTGAHRVFGVSSGAIIWLQAALTLPAIQEAAIFEPPFLTSRSMPTALVKRFDDEIARGRVAAALITGMKAAQLGPLVFDLIPRWLLERLTQSMLAGEDKNAKADDITVRMLAPTLRYDLQLVAESGGDLKGFKGIRAEVLLLGGSKSPAFLQAALDALEKVLPHAKRVEFAGLGHTASGNSRDRMTGRGAQPSRVAEELRRFFDQDECSSYERGERIHD
ncbi:MAG TPA: alpha/beta hydrolase [Candidatus Limnocylindria bacterium]